MNPKITYTFPQDCPVPALAGKTFTGGEFCRIDGTYGEPDAVLFAEMVDGRRVKAKIAGKPELEAALAAHKAEKAAITARLNDLGWPQYRAAQNKAINARADYDRASEYGYPAKQAAAMRAADEALATIAARYPGAAAYASAESYSFSLNDLKSSAGKRAMRAIEQGADPMQAIAEMHAEWSAAAEKAASLS